MSESNTLIDLSLDPPCPKGCAVTFHTKGDSSYEWNPAKINFHPMLQDRAKGQVACTSALMECLLKNPSLIPVVWRYDEHGTTRFIYFPGTTYKNWDGEPSAYVMYWDGGKWQHLLWKISRTYRADDFALIFQ